MLSFCVCTSTVPICTVDFRSSHEFLKLFSKTVGHGSSDAPFKRFIVSLCNIRNGFEELPSRLLSLIPEQALTTDHERPVKLIISISNLCAFTA